MNGRGDVGPRLFYYDDAWSDLDRSLEWIAARAQPADIIATSAPHWSYLKTGLKSVMVPMADDAMEHSRLLAEIPARWVIVDELSFSNMTQRYTLPAMEADPGHWRSVFTGPAGKVTVFERVSSNRQAKASPG